MTIQSPIIQYRRDLWRLLPARAKIVECGVAEGRYSEELMRWPIQVDLLYLVDAWKTLPGAGDGAFPQEWHDRNYRICVERMAQFKDRVVILRGLSTVMVNHIPDASLDLAYIDAAHDYNGAVADIRAYWAKVKPGGVLAGHDYLEPSYGVNRAANEFAAGHGRDLVVMHEDKPEDAGFYFRKDVAE